MELNFTIYLEPISFQTSKSHIKAWQILCQQEYLKVLRNHNITQFFPQELEATFYFKNADVSLNEQPYYQKPDLDNLCKVLMDCLCRNVDIKYLTRGDQSIYKLTLQKLWSDTDSRIEIILKGEVTE